MFHEPLLKVLKENESLVRRLGYQLIAKLPANVELDDLIQVGLMGLVDAHEKYDNREDVKFESFAVSRIKGAMIDELRSMDWMSRNDRRTSKKIEAAQVKLINELGRKPTDGEIADKLGLGINEYMNIVTKVYGLSICSIEDLAEDGLELEKALGSYPPPIDEILEQEKHQHALEAIDKLSEKDKLLYSLIYEDGLTLKEVGVILGVTESRVCQLRHDLLQRLEMNFKRAASGVHAKRKPILKQAKVEIKALEALPMPPAQPSSNDWLRANIKGYCL